MPVSPTITLTITLDDLQGAAIGSVGSPAYVEIALANYGPILPRVSGTAMLAKVGPSAQKIPYLGTPITVHLFGNDVITPAGSYYVITVYDDQLNILQSGAYVFTGTVSADLSILAQIFPSATSSVMGSEVTLQATATPTFDCRLVNGPVEFYLVLTQNVTSSTLLPNFAGQIVIIRLQQDATGGRTFVWPTNVVSPGAINSAPNAVTSQAFFVASNGNAYPLEGSGGTYPTSGQIGDMLRWNVNADSAWDAVNAVPNYVGVIAENQLASNLMTVGSYLNNSTTTTIVGGNNVTDLAPTATSQSARIIGQTAAGVTNTIGFSFPQNGSSSLIGMLAFYRWTAKVGFNNVTTNARYWMGLGCFHSTGAGNNGLNNVGSTAYASDTPNKSTVGWRFSTGTDTHWQAVAITAGGSQTTVDTGITPDTGFHLFEMIPNVTGTAVAFYYDFVLVATVSTNLPPPANNQDSWGSLFVAMDNKNQATAISFTFYSMMISLK